MMRRTLPLLAALIVVLGLSAGCTDGGQQQEAAGNGSTSGDLQQEITGDEAKQQETIGSGINPQEAEESTGTKPLTGCVRDASKGRAPRQEAMNEAPNGSLAFAADEDYADDSADSDIYVMNADGTDRTRLTNSELMELAPSWSPDGKKIAFSRRGSIYVMNADGTGRSRLDPYTDEPSSVDSNTDFVNSVDWSPDCKKIAFDAAEGINVINADGSNLKRLVPEVAPTPGVYSGSYYDPAWSPDGRQIAYVEEDEEGIDTLYVIDTAGTAETALTDYENGETGSALSSPTWSPDGEKMAFVSDAGFTGDGGNVVYNSDIYVTGADGSGTMRLTNTPEDEMTPAWAPTARR